MAARIKKIINGSQKLPFLSSSAYLFAATALGYLFNTLFEYCDIPNEAKIGPAQIGNALWIESACVSSKWLTAVASVPPACASKKPIVGVSD